MRRPRREIVFDSGNAGGADPGQRVMLSIDALSTVPLTVATGRSTATVTDTLPIFVHPWEPRSAPAGSLDYVPGYELPDMLALIQALDRLKAEGYSGPVGFVGDNKGVVGHLRGENDLHVWWMGENLAPRILEEVRAREGYFELVEYRWVRSRQNPAGRALYGLRQAGLIPPPVRRVA